jgi:hypothetical protein
MLTTGSQNPTPKPKKSKSLLSTSKNQDKITMRPFSMN